MVSDKSNFAQLEPKDEGSMTYGDNNKGMIVGNGVISNGVSFNIRNIFFISKE